MPRHRITFFFLSVALALGSFAAPTSAKSHGKGPQTLNAVFPNPAFNEAVRLIPVYFGPERPQDKIAERPADPDEHIFIFDGTLIGQGAKSYADAPKILLSDIDNVTADTRSVDPSSVSLDKSASVHVHAVFWVPKDFVPDHLVYVCQNVKCDTLRIKFKRT